MKKVDNGEEKKKKTREKKRMAFLVATTSLPADYCPNDDDCWNAARLCQLQKYTSIQTVMQSIKKFYIFHMYILPYHARQLRNPIKS